MHDLVRSLERLAAVVSCLLVLATQAVPAAAAESVVQFKVTAASTRLSHDLKIVWAAAVNGTQCAGLTVSPTTDKFPGDGLASVRVVVTELPNLWLKAGDVVKADDAGCVLIVTGLYTDATFTRPVVP